MQKNKIYNPTPLKKQWSLVPFFFDQLSRKINKAKLMKFITVEPRRFHPYLVAEFYRKAVAAADEQSFMTIVHDTQFNISNQFLAEKFELSHSGISIYTYFDGVPYIEREH